MRIPDVLQLVKGEKGTWRMVLVIECNESRRIFMLLIPLVSHSQIHVAHGNFAAGQRGQAGGGLNRNEGAILYWG
jgi:hypothetical protein